MRWKSRLAKPFARVLHNSFMKHVHDPLASQDAVFQELIQKGRNTRFGKDHGFDKIKTHEDFKKQVPIRDYEGLRPYVDRIIKGEEDVLWPGKPTYFAKTSGTTSGAKFIPITEDSIPNHINTARAALAAYISNTGNARFADGKMIFLSGSPVLDQKGGILTGRLSGIVHHHVPDYLTKSRMPSHETNCIDDWEEKVHKIAEETINAPMSLISGIPPWVQMYFDILTDLSGKPVGDLFPDFQLFVYGGVNYQPYRKRLEASIGRKVDSIETFPASEGFFAFQDEQDNPGLLLNVYSGIFFEFVPADEIFNEDPSRLSLKDVELDKNYALIVNNNAGLWAYNIGDTVKFVSKDPYRLIVSGRISHYISAFGEHVIASEVDEALSRACEKTGAEVTEFTVAPRIQVQNELPYHEWFIEFKLMPKDMAQFCRELDVAMQEKNIYYQDLIEGKILQQAKVSPVKKDGFVDYMRSVGRLGGQNKLPRLSNDRKIADALQTIITKPFKRIIS